MSTRSRIADLLEKLLQLCDVTYSELMHKETLWLQQWCEQQLDAELESELLSDDDTIDLTGVFNRVIPSE